MELGDLELQHNLSFRTISWTTFFFSMFFARINNTSSNVAALRSASESKLYANTIFYRRKYLSLLLSFQGKLFPRWLRDQKNLVCETFNFCRRQTSQKLHNFSIYNKKLKVFRLKMNFLPLWQFGKKLKFTHVAVWNFCLFFLNFF